MLRNEFKIELYSKYIVIYIHIEIILVKYNYKFSDAFCNDLLVLKNVCNKMMILCKVKNYILFRLNYPHTR